MNPDIIILLRNCLLPCLMKSIASFGVGSSQPRETDPKEYHMSGRAWKSLVFVLLIGSLLFFGLGPRDVSASNPGRSSASDGSKTLTIRIPYRGNAVLEGDIKKGDRIKLFSREYRSPEGVIRDKLLIDTTAETEAEVSLFYNQYSQPLEENRIDPDFTFEGGEVTINALYAVLSDGNAEVRSHLVYTDCFLDSGVVNQYWCTYAGSEACGPAAGAIALQFIDPVQGDEMFQRVNTMRNYCLEGADYCSGAPLFELVEEQVSNTVNRYIREELSADLVFTDHRVPDETTEETLIRLLTTGRPAVIEVCYLRGGVTEQFWGYSHWITVNGFSLENNGYWFRYSDPVTVSYVSVSSDLLDKSNQNVSYENLRLYGNFTAVPTRYIGAFKEPLLSIDTAFNETADVNAGPAE